MQFRALCAGLLKHGKIRRNRNGEVTYEGPLGPRSVLTIDLDAETAAVRSS